MAQPQAGITGASVINRVEAKTSYGNSLQKVASQFHYVLQDTSIEALSKELETNPEIMSLGVLDHEGKLIGLIERAQFFYSLSRPFGRDLLNRKPVTQVTQESQTFPFDMNIFTAAAELGKMDVPRDRIQYYCLVDSDRHFLGLFSSFDLFSLMSQITQQDIALAANLQSRMVKETFTLTKDNISFYAFTQYAKGMGGDFYGVYEILNGEYFFTLCDVSGKGVAASVITSLLWGMLRTADWRKGLGSIIQNINLALIETFHLEKYLTGIFGIYNPVAKEVRFADMGHSLGFLERRGKILKLDGAHLSLPVGIELDLKPRIVRLKLATGDLLTFMTDGVSEQLGANGELKEELQWVATMNQLYTEDTDPRERILQEFESFRNGSPQADDLSALFLRIG